MFLSNIWKLVTGDWGTREVHDARTLTRTVGIALALVVLIGIVTGVQSCTKQEKELPDHILTTSMRG